MGGHQSSRQDSESWLTPPEIMKELGSFDLDPCCPPIMPWVTAPTMLTPLTDGLLVEWHGRVYMNPPWGRKSDVWLEKMAKHGNGIALIPARTETRAFFKYVWEKADAVLFVRGRPSFYRPDGLQAKANCGVPIVLVAYGKDNVEVLAKCNLGICLRLNNNP